MKNWQIGTRCATRGQIGKRNKMYSDLSSSYVDCAILVESPTNILYVGDDIQ